MSSLEMARASRMAVAALQGQEVIAATQARVATQMLVVCAVILDEGCAAIADNLGRQLDKLCERMEEPGARCGFMSGDNGLEHFRRLAWDAAEILVDEKDAERLVKWAKVLREILRQLPECIALAN